MAIHGREAFLPAGGLAQEGRGMAGNGIVKTGISRIEDCIKGCNELHIHILLA